MTNEPDERTDPTEPAEEPGPREPVDESLDAPAEPGEPPPPPAPSPTPPRRRLTRSRHDSVIGGVAGGIAEYLDADPTIVRVVIVVLALISAGAAVLVYIGAWIVMPESDDTAPEAVRERRGGFAPVFWGLVLVVIGVLALLWQLDVALPRWDALLAGLLIAVGLLLLIEARRGLHGGLFAVAIVITLVLGAATLVDVRVDSGFGERTVIVQSDGDLDDHYGHAFGRLTVDLTTIDLAEGITELSTSIAFGELVLELPEDIGIRASTTTLFGSTQFPDAEHAAFSVGSDYRSENYETAEQRLHLDITTLFGSTNVRH